MNQVKKDYKALYEELIARIKRATKYFSHSSGRYYRKVTADLAPEFFNEEEVRRSCQST